MRLLEKLRTYPFIKKIAPGIRIKLAFFTGIFLALILAIATFFNYIHQTKILEVGIMNKIEPSLRSTNSVVVDFENLKNNLILIEEMRIRIKEKKQTLRQYKKVVYHKEDSFLNRLRTIGKAFGINVRYDYAARLVDTPYSVYLSEKELSHLETIAKTMLKYPSGTPINEEDFSHIKKFASVCANLKLKISQMDDEIRDISFKIREFENNKNPSPSDINEAKMLKVSLYNLEKKQKSIFKEYRLNSKQLQKKLKPFYQFPLQKLTEIGLHSGNVRIISVDTDGNPSYDTSTALPEQNQRFAPLEAHENYKNDTIQFFQAIKKIPFFDELTKEYIIDNRSFTVQYRPIYTKPATAERVNIVRIELAKHPSQWRKLLQKDTEISQRLKGIATQLGKRVEELKNKRIPASSDAEYHKLYSQYKKLRAEREKLFAELNPYRDYLPQLQKKYERQIDDLRKKILQIKSEINSFKKVDYEKDEQKKLRFTDLKLQLTEHEAKLNETIETYTQTIENIDQSWQLLTIDAFMHLRNAALYDFMRISYGNDRIEHLRYLHSSKERMHTKARWNTAIQWISSGGDETSLPPTVPREQIKTLESGILAYGRSEIEKYMWQIDSTPLTSSIGLFSVEIDEKSLIAQLLRETTIGYNIIHIDKTEETQKIVSNTRALLLYSSAIALFSIIITYFFAGFMVKRISAIIEGANKVRTGDLTITFPEKGLDEIEMLGISLNAMMKGLREREEMKSELFAAAEIQKHLIPEDLPKNLEGFYSIGTYYLPMKGIGGDYFDFIKIDDSTVLFCIGDVSNHGIAPALVMTMLRSHLRGIVQRGENNLLRILAMLNDMLFYDTPPHIFVTFCIGIIDRTSHTITYVTAGNPHPLLYRYKTQSIEILESGGLPLGMDENAFFLETVKLRTLNIQRGDLFFLYTDGITESMNEHRQQYGEERLVSCIQTNGRKKIPILIETIIRDVHEFVGSPSKESEFTPSDDIAIIALRRLQ